MIRRALLAMLDGCASEDVRSLCVRANTIADLAMRGKYKDRVTAIKLVANVNIISQLTALLGYPRRKCSVPRVEVVHWGGERTLPIITGEVVDEARPVSLLAKIAGPSVGAQLDIKRECVPGDCPGKELQGKEQVLDLVPPDCVERVQSSPAIQAS